MCPDVAQPAVWNNPVMCAFGALIFSDRSQPLRELG
jgi:hypothetical protein